MCETFSILNYRDEEAYRDGKEFNTDTDRLSCTPDPSCTELVACHTSLNLTTQDEASTSIIEPEDDDEDSELEPDDDQDPDSQLSPVSLDARVSK